MRPALRELEMTVTSSIQPRGPSLPLLTVGGLLLVEAFLFVSAYYRWFEDARGSASALSLVLAVAGLLMLLAWVGTSHFRKRRTQFGLGMLLAMIFVLAPPCAWVANEMHKTKPQRELARLVERNGGVLRYFGSYEHDNNRWLVALFGRDYFLDIAEVTLDNGDLIDKLRILPRLEGLRLTSNATDSDLKNLSHFLQLEYLDLGETKITDDGLAHLADLPKLRQIYLDGTKITDDGFMQLSKFRSLKCVNVSMGVITRNGTARLKESLPGLVIDTPVIRPPISRPHRN